MTADRNASIPPPPPSPAPSIQPIHSVNNHTNFKQYTAPPPPIAYTSSNSLPLVFDDDNSDDFVPKQVNRSNSAQPATTRRSNRLSSQTVKQNKGKSAETTPYILLDSPPIKPSTLPPAQVITPQIENQNTLEQSVTQTENEPLKSKRGMEELGYL